MLDRSVWIEDVVEPSEEELERATLCLLDWLGCAIAGRPAALELFDGACVRAEPAEQAFMNGVAGHLLDYDDTLPEALAHPSAVLWPSLLAIAGNGRELLRGFLYGVEAQSMWGLQHAIAITESFGHPTAALGTVAATFAVCRVKGLSELQVWHAVRMAGALAAGSQSVFGTPGKSIQVGYAARTAVEMSCLKWRDLPTSDWQVDPLLIRGGLVDRLTRATRPEHWDSAAGAERSQQFTDQHPVHRIIHKFHASCYATHGALDAFRNLGIGSERIRSASVTIGDSFPAVATAPITGDGLGAKFSMKACLALVACGYDTADPAAFDWEPLSDPCVLEFVSRIDCRTDVSIPSGAGDVTLHLTDGSTVHEYANPSSVEFLPGERRSRVEAKFRRLADPVIGADTAKRITIDVLDQLAHCTSEQLSLVLENAGLLLQTSGKRR